ncbi:hypothetical protein Tco_1275582 [Tanacetum coccineum]
MADLAFVKQHNMVAYLEKTEENAEFHQILDFLTSSSINFSLIVSPTIYALHIEQFWNTAYLKTINSEKQIHANVDGKAVVVSESSEKRNLQLNDEDGTACLTTNKIFENLALMGYEPASNKLTFYRGCDEAINEEMLDSVERVATAATSLEAEQSSGSGPWRQETIGGMQAQTRSEGVSNLSSNLPLSGGHTLGSGEDSMEHQIELTDNVPNTPHDSPLPLVNIPGSDKGRLKLEELMVMCTKLLKQVLDLEKEKDAQAVEILKLKKRVKKLERQRKSSISHPRRRIYRQVRYSNDDLDEEDASKQGRISDKTKPMFKDSDFDDLDDLVDEGMDFVQQKDAENQGKIGADDIEVVTQKQIILLTLLKMKEEKAKEKGVAIKDIEDSSRPIKSITTLQPLPTIDLKDKVKGILQEIEPMEKTKKMVQGDAQIERDAEVALRLQAELDEELRVERERQEEASKVAIAEMFDEVQGLYERQQKRIQDFTPMDLEKEAQKPGKRLKRVADHMPTPEVTQENKVMKSAKDVTEEEAAEYEKEKEELRLSLKIISNDNSEVNYELLSKKFPTVKYQLLGKIEEKDMQDLNDLYSYGIHTLFMDGTSMEINMLVEKKYPLVKELLEKMLNLRLEAEEESTMAFELIKFIKSLLEEMSTPVFADPESSTQADGAQSSRVPVPLLKDPYEAIMQAYLDGTDIESEPFEDPIDTEAPGLPLTMAPPISLSKSTPPALVPILCRTARMAVRIPHAMSSGLSASMAEVAAMSEFAFRKRFQSSYESSLSMSPPDLPSQKHYQGTSELVEDSEEDDNEEDEEIEESMDSDSLSEDAKDEGPTIEDKDPAMEDEGLTTRVEGPGMDDKSYGLDVEEDEEVIPGGQQQAASVVGTASSDRVLDLHQSLRDLRGYRHLDGMVFIDVPTYPPPAPPVQTPPLPEWTSGSLPISPSPFDVPSPTSSPMIPLTVPFFIATPATAETEGFLTELGAQVEMQRGLICNLVVRLEELSSALFERYDRNIRELFTRSGMVRDDIFS